MRILSFDPGFGRTGWGALERSGTRFAVLDYGLIETSNGMSHGERLQEIYNQVEHMIGQLEPDLVAMEKLIFGKSRSTAAGVFQAQGVILAAAGKHRLEVLELGPKQIKLALTGSGNADKKSVEMMVRRILGIQTEIRPDDTADALAIGIAGAMQQQWNQVQLQN
ncbi:MAG: crossover junction endodeoxyribonuclease RuvC [Leptospiraceae bacterium]|nr:crossover junction endodeoxyribonuclease RuvC [Leptospiraceae bacterium]